MRNNAFCYFAFVLPLAIFILFSCSGKRNGKTTSQTNEKPRSVGYTVYNQYCLACHQVNGSGVPGLYPPLAKNEKLNGDHEHLIRVIIQGFKGEILVDGKVYNSTMPAHNYLTDEQIAEVLNFVRINFGAPKDSITTDEVTKIRKLIDQK